MVILPYRFLIQVSLYGTSGFTSHTYLDYLQLLPITSNNTIGPKFNPNLNIKIPDYMEIGAAVLFNSSITQLLVHSEILPTCVAHCNKPIPSASRFLSSNRFVPTSSSSC